MRERLLIVVITCFFTASICAQPEKKLNQWAEESPIEKIYFHFDRNDYWAGQTIWFKGYLYSDFLPAEKSTTVFAELISESGQMINRQVLPVFLGFTRGQIDLPDTLAEGKYLLQAYTATMLNHDASFIYKRTFFITGKKQASPPATVKAGLRMEFFPEGGSFVTGLSNTIAFKATNEKGLPVAMTGVVRKESGEQVATFSSVHDGMGYFDITPEGKTNYYVTIDQDAGATRYPLPSHSTKGVVLRIISSNKTKTYEVLQRDDDPLFKAAYMIGQMQHHVVFKKEFSQSGNEMSGIIQTANLSSGILQVTVFNKDNMPLAERITFVDNREYILPATLSIDTVSFLPRALNHFTLSLKDTVNGSFSVSVYDAAFDTRTRRADNIFSGLLLTSDLQGYIHDPAWYFTSADDSVQNALDLVMMTNGWRRFYWKEFLKKPVAPSTFKDPGYIALDGKINITGSKKPFADKELMMLIRTPDSARNVQMIRTDATGHFHHDSVIFFNRARILFTDIKGKRNKSIEVKMSEDSLHRPYNFPALPTRSWRDVDQPTSIAASSQRIRDEYDAAIKAEGQMLQGVTVKSRKKTALELVEERYVKSGLFEGTSNHTFDLVSKTDETIGYQTIFDYLVFRVPGLQVMREDGRYFIYYRQGPTASALGPIPMALFLDEVAQTDAEAIAAIPPDQVALVKLYSNFAGASGGGPGGALAVYLKKGDDFFSSRPAAGDEIRYNGFSVIKEFYHPDYKVEKPSQPDNRITLHWNPTVFVNGVDIKVPVRFYNNDRTRQFRVVIEGMTSQGKMLMIEQTIGSDKKAF